MVYVQVRVVVSALVLHRLSEYGTLVVSASLTTPRKGRSPETLVEGHADSVEAPGKFVPRRSEATDAQLDRLRKPAAVLRLAGGEWKQKAYWKCPQQETVDVPKQQTYKICNI